MQVTGAAGAGAVLPRLGADELADVVVQLWRSAVPTTGTSSARDVPAVGVRPAAGTPVLRAHVAVEGASATAWSGDVVVACAGGAARRWARRLLALGADELLAADDVRDVVGEVANVVAGAVKARCAPGGLLGLPRVDEAPAPLGPADGRDVVLVTVLRWPGPADDADDDVTVVELVTR